MNFEKSHEEVVSTLPLSMGEAIVQMAALQCEIMAMGANDAENDMINGSIFQLQEGQITPGEAVAKVQLIRYNKQDYH